jgi:hypothetical protein
LANRRVSMRKVKEMLRLHEPPDTSVGCRAKPVWRSDEALLSWLASL